MKESILKHYNALLEDVLTGEVCPFSALNEVSRLVLPLQTLRDRLKDFAVQDSEFDTKKHLITAQVWKNDKRGFMTRNKFVQILEDADLYNWFRFEFGDELGENWESDAFYKRGWHFDGFCISFREKPAECEMNNYQFAGGDFNRNALLKVLLSHGYQIERNEPDEDDGWLLLILKDKYQ
jgi:hypothetical protein